MMKNYAWLIPFILITAALIGMGVFALLFPYKLRELNKRYRSSKEERIPIYGKLMTNYINSKAFIIANRIMGAIFLFAGFALIYVSIMYFLGFYGFQNR